MAKPVRPSAHGKSLERRACKKSPGTFWRAAGCMACARPRSRAVWRSSWQCLGDPSTPNTADLRPARVPGVVGRPWRSPFILRSTRCDVSSVARRAKGEEWIRPSAHGKSLERRACKKSPGTFRRAAGCAACAHPRSRAVWRRSWQCLGDPSTPNTADLRPARVPGVVGRPWRSPSVHQRMASPLRDERAKIPGACRREAGCAACFEAGMHGLPPRLPCGRLCQAARRPSCSLIRGRGITHRARASPARARARWRRCLPASRRAGG